MSVIAHLPRTNPFFRRLIDEGLEDRVPCCKHRQCVQTADLHELCPEHFKLYLSFVCCVVNNMVYHPQSYRQVNFTQKIASMARDGFEFEVDFDIFDEVATMLYGAPITDIEFCFECRGTVLTCLCPTPAEVGAIDGMSELLTV